MSLPDHVATRLGTMPDTKLAELAELPYKAIRDARLDAGIPVYRKPIPTSAPRPQLDVEAARAVIRRLAAGLGLVEVDGETLRYGAFAAVSRYARRHKVKLTREAVRYAWEHGVVHLDRWPLAGLPVPVPPAKVQP